MIIYSKAFWGIKQLGRAYGSAFPRTIPAAVLTAAFTACLAFATGKESQTWWRHPYPFQIFSFVVGFILVFRTTHGYARYWEARTKVSSMVNKWADFIITALNFDRAEDRDVMEELKADRFARVLVHYVSMINACAFQALRRDPDLGNLVHHSSKMPAPPMDSRELTQRSNSSPAKCKTARRTVPLYGILSWKEVFMLHSSSKHLKDYNQAFTLSVIGGVSRDEWDELACADDTEFFTNPTTQVLFGEVCCCYDHVQYMQRPMLITSWIQELLMQRQLEGGLNVPAPILSRIYTLFSEGLSGFEQCRKIADTPFPFPWAQFILVMLIVHSFTAPLVIIAFCPNITVAMILSVVASVTYWAINEVARDLEDPFIYEPNEIPLAKLQYDFNDLLRVVSRTRRPRCEYELSNNFKRPESIHDIPDLSKQFDTDTCDNDHHDHHDHTHHVSLGRRNTSDNDSLAPFLCRRERRSTTGGFTWLTSTPSIRIHARGASRPLHEETILEGIPVGDTDTMTATKQAAQEVASALQATGQISSVIDAFPLPHTPTHASPRDKSTSPGESHPLLSEATSSGSPHAPPMPSFAHLAGRERERDAPALGAGGNAARGQHVFDVPTRDLGWSTDGDKEAPTMQTSLSLQFPHELRLHINTSMPNYTDAASQGPDTPVELAGGSPGMYSSDGVLVALGAGQPGPGMGSFSGQLTPHTSTSTPARHTSRNSVEVSGHSLTGRTHGVSRMGPSASNALQVQLTSQGTASHAQLTSQAATGPQSQLTSQGATGSQSQPSSHGTHHAVSNSGGFRLQQDTYLPFEDSNNNGESAVREGIAPTHGGNGGEDMVRVDIAPALVADTSQHGSTGRSPFATLYRHESAATTVSPGSEHSALPFPLTAMESSGTYQTVIGGVPSLSSHSSLDLPLNYHNLPFSSPHILANSPRNLESGSATSRPMQIPVTAAQVSSSYQELPNTFSQPTTLLQQPGSSSPRLSNMHSANSQPGTPHSVAPSLHLSVKGVTTTTPGTPKPNAVAAVTHRGLTNDFLKNRFRAGYWEQNARDMAHSLQQSRSAASNLEVQVRRMGTSVQSESSISDMLSHPGFEIPIVGASPRNFSRPPSLQSSPRGSSFEDPRGNSFDAHYIRRVSIDTVGYPETVLTAIQAPQPAAAARPASASLVAGIPGDIGHSNWLNSLGSPSGSLRPDAGMSNPGANQGHPGSKMVVLAETVAPDTSFSNSGFGQPLLGAQTGPKPAAAGGHEPLGPDAGVINQPGVIRMSAGANSFSTSSGAGGTWHRGGGTGSHMTAGVRRGVSLDGKSHAGAGTSSNYPPQQSSASPRRAFTGTSPPSFPILAPAPPQAQCALSGSSVLSPTGLPPTSQTSAGQSSTAPDSATYVSSSPGAPAAVTQTAQQGPPLPSGPSAPTQRNPPYSLSQNQQAPPAAPTGATAASSERESYTAPGAVHSTLGIQPSRPSMEYSPTRQGDSSNPLSPVSMGIHQLSTSLFDTPYMSPTSGTSPSKTGTLAAQLPGETSMPISGQTSGQTITPESVIEAVAALPEYQVDSLASFWDVASIVADQNLERKSSQMGLRNPSFSHMLHPLSLLQPSEEGVAARREGWASVATSSKDSTGASPRTSRSRGPDLEDTA